MRFCRFMSSVMIILGKITIVVIFVISGIALGKAIIDSEEVD